MIGISYLGIFQTPKKESHTDLANSFFHLGDFILQSHRCTFEDFFFLFLRKISPELTAANPPLAEEDWP